MPSKKPKSKRPVVRRTSPPSCSASKLDLLLAGIYLRRFWPMAPHHISALREALRNASDSEIQMMVRSGKWPNAGRLGTAAEQTYPARPCSRKDSQ